MYRVVYVSSATKLLTSSALLELAVNWQARNKETGITGVCLYIGGNFMQAFEGEDAPARALFDRIKTNKLHRHITTIMSEEAADNRAFGDWSLDFREAADLPNNQLSEFQSFIDETLTGKKSDRSGPAVELLTAFVRRMHPHMERAAE